MAEWLVFDLSALLVTATVVVLGIEATTIPMEPTRLVNTGGRAAHNVEVVVNATSGGQITTAICVFDFIPGGCWKSGGHGVVSREWGQDFWRRG